MKTIYKLRVLTSSCDKVSSAINSESGPSTARLGGNSACFSESLQLAAQILLKETTHVDPELSKTETE